MTSTSYEIEKNLHLVHLTVDKAKPAKPAETPTNHIAAVDVSGSMSSDLPKLRTQLKNKLKTLLKEGDTLSMVWFSGRGEADVLFEAEPVATLKDLATIFAAIDRWLKPVGLTGFKEPIEKVVQLIGRVGKKNSNPFSLFFMSDGCDNQWPRADILKACESAAGLLASATFVEYGYYADRPLLAAMAEKTGGTLIFADAFDKYEASFEAAMQKRPLGGKRIEVKLDGDVIGGFAWALADGAITTYDASSGKVMVPEGIDNLYYLAPTLVGANAPGISSQAVTRSATIAPAYAAMSLFAVRMKPDVVYPILKALGDVTFINAFSICFGKQKYSDFMDAAQAAAFDPKLRFIEGRDPNKIPDDDAFTVLGLLSILAEDPTARVLLDHPAFKYSRISRGRVDADENLSADEALAVETIRGQMAGEKSAKKLKELQVELDKVLSAKQDALKFVADPQPDGYEISSLTYNQSSPNISMLIRKTGKVDLSGRPDHAKHKIPTLFDTYIFRNYAIVSNGLVNVDKLPVKMSDDTWERLVDAGVEMLSDGNNKFIIDVKKLPIINRSMVKAISAKSTIELEWALLQKRCAAKVFKAYQDEKFPGVKTASMKDKYGDDAAAWLDANGFTYNGFAPKSVQAESKDFIVAKDLEIKLKGCSTIASVKAVKDKAGKKLNAPDSFMAAAILECETFLKDNPAKLHKDWLVGKAKTLVAETRGLLHKKAQMTFGIIVGQIWFSEFASLDDKTLTVKIDGVDVIGTCELSEVEIKV